MRTWGLFLVVTALAAALRLADLEARPMHADEAVHADKFGTLLERGEYAYDPFDYHGPTLYYLTLPSAWLQGARRYVDIDEVTLRAVPALFGIALVAAHLGARAFLGAPAALAAALLAALSPAMVFYSRDYIHEMLLVFFSFAALLAGGSYLRRPGAVRAVLVGMCVGLMLATKETTSLALASMTGALILTLWADRRQGRATPGAPAPALGRDALLALLAAALVAGLFFSSFLTRPAGVVDAVRAYALYPARTGAASTHFHPWHYYLGLLLHFPARGTPFWSEGLIIVLALVGGGAAWRSKGIAGADARALRFLTCYTLLMLVLYSAIPYKTPWCLLGFLHGMILLAGAGAVSLLRAPVSRPGRALVAAVLLLATSHLGWQAYSASFRFAADPRNPYVYAQTGTDVFEVTRRVGDLARAHTDGLATPLQVISRENLWPLPWYLRQFTRVAWWNGVSDTAPSAPVILVTPEMQPALVRRLYEVPPPGERPLYVSIFERPIELRPGVELRGYALQTLWEKSRDVSAIDAGPRP